MSPAVAAVLAAALILSGLLAGGIGFVAVPAKPARRSHSPKRGRRTQLVVAISLLVGLAAAAVSGWVILIILIPLVAVAGPYLLAKNANLDVARLDAFDEWARSLAGVLGAGVSLEQAITVTRGSAPSALQTEINTLVARIRSRMSLENALRRFAAEVGDATCDKIVCTLLLANRRGDGGLARVLTDLAESVAEDVAARRMVAAERAKQTTAMRAIMLITAFVFGGFLLAGGSYVAPYSTPLGQLVLAILLTAYVATLFWMKWISRAKPLPRLFSEEEGAKA